jgi:hypothetical protein
MNDVIIRLSIAHLRELMERASTGNYMLVQAEDGAWVQIHPFEPEE